MTLNSSNSVSNLFQVQCLHWTDQGLWVCLQGFLRFQIMINQLQNAWNYFEFRVQMDMNKTNRQHNLREFKVLSNNKLMTTQFPGCSILKNKTKIELCWNILDQVISHKTGQVMFGKFLVPNRQVCLYCINISTGFHI